MLRPSFSAAALAPDRMGALAHPIGRLCALHVGRRDGARRDGLRQLDAVLDGDTIESAGTDQAIVRLDRQVEVGPERESVVVARVEPQRLKRRPRLLGIRVANCDEVRAADRAVADARAEGAARADEKENGLRGAVRREVLAERLGVLAVEKR
eukprot:3140349-Prymnesium_polylepis.1